MCHDHGMLAGALCVTLEPFPTYTLSWDGMNGHRKIPVANRVSFLTEIIKMNQFWVAVLLIFVVALLLIDDRYCRICVKRTPKTE